MESSNSTSPAQQDFDPLTQNIPFRLREGGTIDVSLYDVQAYVFYGLRLCINYSSQLAASLVLLVMLLILTKKGKRLSAIFVLNVLSLAINAIRSLLQCLYFTGPFFHPYAVFTGDYYFVGRSDVATSVAAGVLTLLLVICVETSLALQVRVVLITAPEVQRFWVMVLAMTVAMVAVAFRFALTIINAQYIVRMEEFTEWYWLASACTITLTVSIFFFSAVFVGKLGHAIVRRRRLGLKQFGPMQIVFIMGSQTLIIPALFAGLQHIGTIVEFVTLVLTVVTISLPLSALWASASIDDKAVPARVHPMVQKQFHTSSSNESRTLNGSYDSEGEKAHGVAKESDRGRYLSSSISADGLEDVEMMGPSHHTR